MKKPSRLVLLLLCAAMCLSLIGCDSSEQAPAQESAPEPRAETISETSGESKAPSAEAPAAPVEAPEAPAQAPEAPAEASEASANTPAPQEEPEETPQPFDQVRFNAAAEELLAEYARLRETGMDAFIESAHPQLPQYSAVVATNVQNNLYYALYDFDDNGVPEVVIAAGKDEHPQPVGIYAFDGLRMVYLCKDQPLGERSSVTFDDGLFFVRGSGSAYSGAVTVYRIGDDGFSTDVIEVMDYEYLSPETVIFTPEKGNMDEEEFLAHDYLGTFEIPTAYTRFVTGVEETKKPLEPPKILVQPDNLTVGEGSTATFSITAQGEELKFQWFYRKPGSTQWTAVTSNGVFSSYSLFTEKRHDGYVYHCVVSNAAGSATSVDVKLTVVARPEITSQPRSQTVGVGKIVTFSVKAKGEGLRYQWYYKTPGSSYWNRVTKGGTSPVYTFTAADRHNGYVYHCVVSNGVGYAISYDVKLTVNISITITSQPKDQSVGADNMVTFAVKAKGKNLEYQWYYMKPGTNEWTPVRDYGTSPTYNLIAESRHNGYKYRCRIKNDEGTVFSSTATLKVVSKPSITAQPSNKRALVGDKVTFSIQAKGQNLKYQWFYLKPGAGSWEKVSANGNSSSFTVHVADRHDGYKYRCQVKNAGGSVYSNAATLSLIKAPTITTQPENKTVSAGKTAKFSVGASGSGLKYQWYFMKPGTNTWEKVTKNGTSATYSLTTAARHNGYKYRCRVSNGAGHVYTRSVTLTVK